MIKLEKRLMQWCEDCDEFAPCSMKIEEKQNDNSYAIEVVVMCQHADICSNAIHQYQKTCENTPEIKNVPSPCKDCKVINKKPCDGCMAYYEWREKYDD